jgi:hypothetical protein
MSRSYGLVVAVAAALALTGCAGLRGGNCHDTQPYQLAKSVPSLQVPEGLSAPQSRNSLKIPDVDATARPRGPGDPCLDEPPSFYPGRPKPGAAPAAPPAGDRAAAPAGPVPSAPPSQP